MLVHLHVRWKLLYVFVVVCMRQSEWRDCVHVMLVCALVYGCACMLMLMLFVCAWWGLCVWWGSLFLAIHRQFVRPAVEAEPKPVEQLEPLHD